MFKRLVLRLFNQVLISYYTQKMFSNNKIIWYTFLLSVVIAFQVIYLNLDLRGSY